MAYIVALLNSIGIVWAKRFALIILAIMLVDVTLTVRKLVDFRTALVKIKDFVLNLLLIKSENYERTTGIPECRCHKFW